MKKDKFLWPLTDASLQLSWRAKLMAVKTLFSNQLTMGSQVLEFEQEFANYLGAQHAVMTNSGSSANLLAVAALFHHPTRPLHRGDEVIVPAIAWSTTYAPLAQYGLRLRVVDTEPETLNADMREVERAWSIHTRLLVGVSVLGEPAALDEMRKLADARGTWFMEDNCESLGAHLHGKMCGTFGHVSTCSTFFTHQLSTIEGGMLVTNDNKLADLARCLRAHGWARDLLAQSHLLRDLPLQRSKGGYRFLLSGYNLRPTELQAAIGLAQLKHLETAQSWRRHNAEIFLASFYGHPQFTYPRHLLGSVPFGFVLIARTPELRERAFAVMDRAGIEYRMVTGGCFTEHEAAQHYDYATVGELPNARHVHYCGFFVGNHPRNLSREIAVLKETLEKVTK